MLSKCDKNIKYLVVKFKRAQLTIQAISRIFSNPCECGEKADVACLVIGQFSDLNLNSAVCGHRGKFMTTTLCS